MQKFKIGDKVKWIYKNNAFGDMGEIIKIGDKYAVVLWKDGEEHFYDTNGSTWLTSILVLKSESDDDFKEKSPTKEEEISAIQVLLSLGYTICKKPITNNITTITSQQ